MKFEYEETIPYPVDRVYAALRDEMTKIVPFLPEVESIEVLERREEGPGRLFVLNLWQATPAAAPAAVRPFLSKKMTAWKDHAHWNDDERKVEWRFETFHFDRLYDCSGVNTWYAAGDGGTRFHIVGTLDVHGERVPGVPKLLGRKLGPKIEAFLIKSVTPNLEKLPGAVGRYLASLDEA